LIKKFSPCFSATSPVLKNPSAVNDFFVASISYTYLYQSIYASIEISQANKLREQEWGPDDDLALVSLVKV
jgi:hypothetical protein